MHIPVLTRELVKHLRPRKHRKFIDATLGQGGHAEKFLQEGAFLLGIELDNQLLGQARERLSGYKEKILIQGNYKDIGKIARSHDLNEFSGIYFDLGVCLWHFQNSGRGFSFRKNEPLNMRFDGRRKGVLTAQDIVNSWPKGDIQEVLKKYGEERFAQSIADGICDRRQKDEIKTTRDLVEIILDAVPSMYDSNKGTHPARRTFQALRIVVNGEMENIRTGLREAEMLLRKGGRLAVISFHSLEDRPVKKFFKDNPRLDIITPSPVVPDPKEVEVNPAARSAKLRVAERKL